MGLQTSTGSPATATPLRQRFTTRRLRCVTLGPVRRDDWLMMGRFYTALSLATLRRPFHGASSAVEASSEGRIRAMTAQLMALDRKGLLLMATVSDPWGAEIAVAHAGWVATDADTAEFALVVADGYQRDGIGTALMLALMEGARQREVGWLQTTVIDGNAGMLQWLRHCGFWCATTRNEGGLIDVQGVVKQRGTARRAAALPESVRARVSRRCRSWFHGALEAAA